MKALNTSPTKRTGKTEREREVLLGLIDYYIETGKPVGSNTLKEAGFEHLSSATIRNYYSKLEEQGYLHQPHASGGRIPTELAYRFFASAYEDKGIIDTHDLKAIEDLKNFDNKKIHLLIRRMLEEISLLSGLAAFISLPRFDRDFVVDIKILPIDAEQILCVMMTDFGAVHTELLSVKTKLSTQASKRIENYLRYRLSSREAPHPLDLQEFSIAQRIYNEIMVRFLIGYTNFTEEEILRSGFSELLHFSEFHDPLILAESLAIFESPQCLRHIVRETISHNRLRYAIGSDLLPYGAKTKETAIISIPYSIHQQPVGAICLLGPLRIPYRRLFGLLQAANKSLSEWLTQHLYKFKVTYRQPEQFVFMDPENKITKIAHNPVKLIEPRKR